MAGPGVSACQTIDVTAESLVINGWDVYYKFASDAYRTATQNAASIGQFRVDFVNWNTNYNVDATLSGFNRPARPDLVDITAVDLTGQITDAPTLTLPTVVLEAAPQEPVDILSPPPINLTIHAPDALDVDRPVNTNAPDFNIAAPTDPTTDLDLILAPILVEPPIPTAPTLDIDPFGEAAPVFNAPPPSETIDYVETPYVSAFLDAVKAHLTRLMDGEAMPPEVEATLWSRAIDRDDQANAQALQEVNEDFASRGFGAEPNGMLAKRRLELIQNNRNKRGDLTRDIYLEQQKVVVENVRFAVTQGIALEGTLIQMYMQIEQRKFDLAVKLKDVAIAIFQARVTEYNAVVQAFNARIAAYQAFVDSKKAQAEIYRSQVEAAKVLGDINEQRVRAYEARLRAEGVKADIFRAQVEGFRARIDAERSKIEAFKAEVDAYRSQVEAYKVEWDAERTRIEAEARKGELYKTMVDAYSTRVEVWKTKAGASIENHRENLLGAQALLQQHDAQIKTVAARLEAQRVMIQAEVAQNDAAARMYTADVAVETAASEVDMRLFNAQVAKENARLEILLKDASLQIQQANQNASLLLRALESGAQVSAQLAASSMSAVNFSAGVSHSTSFGTGCQTSFSYSGEILDAG
jgi:hypothetical protein